MDSWTLWHVKSLLFLAAGVKLCSEGPTFSTGLNKTLFLTEICLGTVARDDVRLGMKRKSEKILPDF